MKQTVTAPKNCPLNNFGQEQDMKSKLLKNAKASAINWLQGKLILSIGQLKQ